MRARLLSLPLALATTLSWSCTEHNLSVIPDVWESDLGSITGRACDPYTNIWLENGMVYAHIFDNSGMLYDTRITYTDADGNWTLIDMPVDRSYDVYIQIGNEVVGSEKVPVKPAEPNVVLDEPECNDFIETTVAVISGDYNNFEEMFQSIGVGRYDTVNGQVGSEMIDFLSEPTNLEAYDVVFFDSGHLEEDVIYDTDGSDIGGDVDKVHRSISTYVEGGGIVFANDWSYDLLEQLWPNEVDFLGDDAIPDDAQIGEPGLVIATVRDASLAGALGTDTFQVLYDLAVWPPIETISPSVTVHLEGDVQYRVGDDLFTLTRAPLLISFSVGSGQVLFSTYRHADTSTAETISTLQYLLSDI